MGIHAHPVARLDHGGGVELFHHGGPRELGPRSQPLASVHGRLPPAAVEPHASGRRRQAPAALAVVPPARPSRATGRRRPMTAVRRFTTRQRICLSSTSKRSQYARSNPTSSSSRAKSVPPIGTVSTWVWPTNCMSASWWTATVSMSTPSAARRRRPSSTCPVRMTRASRTSIRARSRFTVFTKSWRTSATRQPSAEVIPGRAGTSTLGIASSRASAVAWSGPAPPKANRTKSRGSWPRWSDTSRMAPAIRSFTTRSTAAATSSGPSPRWAPSFLSNSSRTRESAGTPSTPRRPRGFRRPSSRFASVIVGSSPPRPYAMGPGIAPALSGPTWRMPAVLTRAIDPPPAPMVWMSIIGTRTGRP